MHIKKMNFKIFDKMIKVFVFLVIFFPSNAFGMERFFSLLGTFFNGTFGQQQQASGEHFPSILLLELPPEMIYCILDKLDNKTLCKISLVCKTFAAQVREIKTHRQLGITQDGTVILRNQIIELPLSDRLFFNQHLPIIIEGVVTIKCVDAQQQRFSLKSPCIIRSNSTLRVTEGIILEFAPKDNRLEPLRIEEGSGGLVISNATIKTKTNNPDGVFLSTMPISFDGICFIDASGGRLILTEGISIQPRSEMRVLEGEIQWS